MILSTEHFVKGHQPNIATLQYEDLTHVRCYHASRLTDDEVDAIRQNGLCLPSERWLIGLLGQLGVDDVDSSVVRSIIDTNGSGLFVGLNRNRLFGYKYHLSGSEKVRKAVIDHWPDKWGALEAHLQVRTGCMIELLLPVSSIQERALTEDIFGQPDEQLEDSAEEVDVTFEIEHNIAPKHIVGVCFC